MIKFEWRTFSKKKQTIYHFKVLLSCLKVKKAIDVDDLIIHRIYKNVYRAWVSNLVGNECEKAGESTKLNKAITVL